MMASLPKTTFDPVQRPSHYNSHASNLAAIEVARYLSFSIGNAFKYVFRHKLKNGPQDLQKALWYVRDAIEHPNSGANHYVPPEGHHALSVILDHETDPFIKVALRALVQFAHRGDLQDLYLVQDILTGILFVQSISHGKLAAVTP